MFLCVFSQCTSDSIRIFSGHFECVGCNLQTNCDTLTRIRIHIRIYFSILRVSNDVLCCNAENGRKKKKRSARQNKYTLHHCAAAEVQRAQIHTHTLALESVPQASKSNTNSHRCYTMPQRTIFGSHFPFNLRDPFHTHEHTHTHGHRPLNPSQERRYTPFRLSMVSRVCVCWKVGHVLVRARGCVARPHRHSCVECGAASIPSNSVCCNRNKYTRRLLLLLAECDSAML